MGKHLKRKASSRNEDSNDESPRTKSRRLDDYEGGQGSGIGHASGVSSYDKSSEPDKGSNRKHSVRGPSGASLSAGSSEHIVLEASNNSSLGELASSIESNSRNVSNEMRRHIKRKASSRTDDTNEESPRTKIRRLESHEGGEHDIGQSSNMSYEGGEQCNDIGHSSVMSSCETSRKSDKGSNSERNVGGPSGASWSAVSSSLEHSVPEASNNNSRSSHMIPPDSNATEAAESHSVVSGEEHSLLPAQEPSRGIIHLHSEVAGEEEVEPSVENISNGNVSNEVNIYPLLDEANPSLSAFNSDENAPATNYSVGDQPSDESSSDDGSRGLSSNESIRSTRMNLMRNLRRRRQTLRRRILTNLEEDLRAGEERVNEELQINDRGGRNDGQQVERRVVMDEEEERRILTEFNASIGYTGEEDANYYENLNITQEEINEAMATFSQMAAEEDIHTQEINPLEADSAGLIQAESDNIHIRTFSDVDTDSSSSNKCSICLSNFQNGDAIRILNPCTHEFHQTCVDKWLKENITCPLCRTPVNLY